MKNSLIHWRRPIVALASCFFIFTAAAVACEPPRAVEKIIAHPPKILFVGEWHGTNEVPALVAETVCALLNAGKTVNVAFEYSLSWAEMLRGHVLEQGSRRAAFSAQLAVEWNRRRTSVPDGLTSFAMWRQLDRLHELSGQFPGKLKISTFDSREWRCERKPDLCMADMLIVAVERANADITVSETGELHARQRRDTVSFSKDHQPMAYGVRLARPNWPLMSLKASSITGNYWGCTYALCGPMNHRSKLLLEAPQIRTSIELDEEGFQGTFYVGKFTVSPPFDPASNRQDSESKVPVFAKQN